MFAYCTRLLIGCVGENLGEAAFGLSSAKFIRGTPGRRASLANRWRRRHSAVPVASSPVRPALCCRLLCSGAECSRSLVANVVEPLFQNKHHCSCPCALSFLFFPPSCQSNSTSKQEPRELSGRSHPQLIFPP